MNGLISDMITVYALSAFRPELKGLIRDVRVIWTMEELGIPYRRKVMNAPAGEHKQPDYLAINPFGKVPAIQDGEFKLYESMAICTYLADKAGKLIPKAGTNERALFNQWAAFSVSTLEPFAARIFGFDFFIAKDATTEKLRKDVLDGVSVFMKALNTELSARKYILGDSFTVADILLSSVCRLVGHTEVVDGYPVLKTYLENNFKRPAFIRALENNG